MITTLEAVTDDKGWIRLFEKVHLTGTRRVLVTILDDEPSLRPVQIALMSETSLQDWNRPEEDAA